MLLKPRQAFLFACGLMFAAVLTHRALATMDPDAVQLLLVKPDGTRLLLNSGPKPDLEHFSYGLSVFTGTWTKVRALTVTKEGAATPIGPNYWPETTLQQYRPNLQALWPDVQQQAAKLGADAVLYTAAAATVDRSESFDGALIGLLYGNAVVLHGTTSIPSAAQPLGHALPTLRYTDKFITYRLGPGAAAPASGDEIVVSAVTGDQPMLGRGSRYLVEGTYRLQSKPTARLILTAAPYSGLEGCPQLRVRNGAGRFYFLITTPDAPEVNELRLAFRCDDREESATLRIANPPR